MRNFLHLLAGVILLPAAISAADLSSVLQREAGKFALAWQRSDYEKIITFLPPPVISKSGGRAVAVRELKEQFAQARSLGAERLEAVLGRPAPFRKIGFWLTSVIPVTAVVHSARLDLTQQTHVLGLSNDQGKHWFFVLLYQATQDDLSAWFPEFKGKLIVPVEPAPQMDFVY